MRRFLCSWPFILAAFASLLEASPETASLLMAGTGMLGLTMAGNVTAVGALTRPKPQVTS
jgi:hypothetical protein